MTAAIAFLASASTPAGDRVLAVSDRAALEQAMQSTVDAVAVCWPDDNIAAEYAAALSCRVTFADRAADVPAFDTAWIGTGFLEQTGDEFAAQLAERHAASLIFDVLSATPGSDGTWRIVRAARAGATEVLRVTGPVMLVMSDSAPRPGYVSRYRRQQGRRQMALGPTQIVPSDWQPVRPRTKRSTVSAASLDERTDAAFGLTERSTTASDQPIVAHPLTCAEHLVRYLAHHGFLQRTQISLPARAERVIEEFASAATQEARSASEGRWQDSLASASGSLTSAAARRPRLPAESTKRRVRQPRRVESVQRLQDRRPRPVGATHRPQRGPRRVQAPSSP